MSDRNRFSDVTRRLATTVAVAVAIVAPSSAVLADASTTGVSTEDVPALLAKKHCNACHATAETVVGPPYIAVAARHASNKETMIEVLARKIMHGGGGSWGLAVMPPNQVTLEQAREMARWILEVKQPG